MKKAYRFVLPLSIISLILSCSLGYSNAYAENAAGQSLVKIEGVVTDIVTRKPVTGVTVSVGKVSNVTDLQGHYLISNLTPGTSRMEIAGESIITRSLMVAHEEHTVLDVTVKMSDFNNAMFWASASKREKIMRWRTAPKWVIYSHVLDSDPPEGFAPQDRHYLFNIIRKELPLISSFFNDPQIELFNGRPNDDPRWTGKEVADGCILCAPTHKGGGYANWKASTGLWVRYVKIRNDYKREPKVWRHEIGHALGMAHAFDNEKWLPLGDKDPNYRPTKLHNGVEMYTEWDKLWIYSVYSGSRPAGNMPPDCDPTDFIHGKDIVYSAPNSVFDIKEEKLRP